MDFANENLLIDLGFELIKGMEEKKWMTKEFL
jgi:hypothetical protein